MSTGRPIGRADRWLPWTPPLLAGLWLFSNSVGEPLAQLGVYDGKRVLQLILFPAMLAAALTSRALRDAVARVLRTAPASTLPMLAAFFALGVASALRLPHPGYALVDVAMLLLLLAGALVMAGCRLVLGERFAAITVGAFALTGAGVFALEVAGQAAYLGSGQQYGHFESMIRFAHPRMYNHFQTWTVPLLVLLPLAFPRYRSLRWLVVLLLGLQWYILIAGGARGSTIGLAAASLVALALAPRASGRYLRLQAAGLVIGAGLYLGAVQLLQAAQPGTEAFVQQSVGRELLTTTGRFGLWQQAVEHFLAQPWLGTGPGFYACEAPFYTAASPHNFPLQILSEWGLPAFLLLAALGLRLAWRVLAGLRTLDARDAPPGPGRETRYCLAVACLAAGVDCMVSGLFIAPTSQVAAMGVVGWLWGEMALAGPPADEGRDVRAAPVAPALLLVALLVSLGLLGFARAEYRVLEVRTAYAQDYGPSTPRFWRDGRACFYAYPEDNH